MRLMNATTLEFREFFDSDIPKYAILSHRWGANEATYQDFKAGVHRDRAGFEKIQECCNLAVNHGYEWAWIDTCCIDKESSSELTEAINSMYEWYRKAEVCYVYLVDVIWQRDSSEMHQASTYCFRQSSWFTRGWTLQELLAPANVYFYERHWRFIGSKEDLAQEISEITDIDVQYLLPNAKNVRDEPCSNTPDCRGHPPRGKYWNPDRQEPSIATRMSWISKRQTSRIEDMAYCLLGIFHVNMPLLYGERHRAFMRLQHKIIKQCSDDSIFAWTTEAYGTGVLANWPDKFAKSRYVHERAPIATGRRPYVMTNQGLLLPITWRAWDPKMEILSVLLDCGTCGPQGFKNVVLRLKSSSGQVWNRVHSYCIENLGEGPWYNPLKPSWSITEQDPKQANELITDSIKQPKDLWTPADSLREVGSEIMVQAEWSIGYGLGSPTQSLFISKL